MNETYTSSNPSEHLAYDPLLLHLGGETPSKENQYKEDFKKDKSNIIIKESKDDFSKNKTKEGGEELPAHWEQRKTPDGHIYYANHQTKTTQWHHPNLNNVYSPSATSSIMTNDSISAPSFDDFSKRKTKSSSKSDKRKSDKDKTNNNENDNNKESTKESKESSKDINKNNDNINDNNKISSSSSNVNKKKSGEASKKSRSRSNSVSEMDAFIRVLRTAPKRVKIGYSTLLFSSNPSLSLQVLPVAQLACDWLNSQRKMNFRIENIAMNLNRSLIKGLHLWMTIYKDNKTKHVYDRSRKWACKVFGLSSISMTLDPHFHGNSKSSKIMTDFLTWRTSLPPNVDVVYTLSHSRTYSCVLVLYLSQNPRDPNTDQQSRNEEDLSFQRHHHHRHHHRHSHKDKEGEHKDGEQKKEHNEISDDLYSKSKNENPSVVKSSDLNNNNNNNNYNVNENIGGSNVVHGDSGDKAKGISGSDFKDEKKEEKEEKREGSDWKSEEERNRDLLNPSSQSASASQQIDSGHRGDSSHVKGDHKDGGSLDQSSSKSTEKKDKDKEPFNIENLTVF